MSALFLNANRDPKKGEAATAKDFYHFKPKDKNQIESTACDAFFSLTRDQKMPAWAVGMAPVEELRKNQKNNAVPRPRAWIGEGVVLLNPRIRGDEIRSDFAMIDVSSDRLVTVIDPDSGDMRRLDIKGGATYWATDEVFELSEN